MQHAAVEGLRRERRRARLAQHQKAHEEGQSVEHRGRNERQPHAVVAEHAADRRPGDEAQPEAGAHAAEPARALVLGREVGDGRGGHRHVRARDASDRTAHEQHPQRGREGHEERIDRRARHRHQQHRPAAEAIAERAEHGRAEELHQRIQREKGAEVPAEIAGVADLAQQARHDRHDQADADGVERDDREDHGLRRAAAGEKGRRHLEIYR
jgi:hypothetical protein